MKIVLKYFQSDIITYYKNLLYCYTVETPA